MHRVFSIIFIAFFLTNVSAQLAKATYTMKVSVDMDFSTNRNMPKEVVERIKKRLSEPQTFFLTFDNNQSIYKNEEKLDAPQQGSRGNRVMRFGGADKQITHTNLATRIQTTQQELLGKLFLVTQPLKTPQWNFTGETKQIGNYTAYEATYTHKNKPNQIRMSFGRRSNDKKQEENEEPKEEEVTVSVWFTPDIPIPAGPDKYFGLPGLVLMVQDGNKVYVCTKVQMNSKEKVNLNPPKKGEKVTGEEFKKIREEKTKEMRERFQNNSNRGNKNRIFIRR
jgi:GLPGLI family protein